MSDFAPDMETVEQRAVRVYRGWLAYTGNGDEDDILSLTDKPYPRVWGATETRPLAHGRRIRPQAQVVVMGEWKPQPYTLPRLILEAFILCGIVAGVLWVAFRVVLG